MDLTPALTGGDRSRDVVLQWGDVVEVPEIDHPINTTWTGFTEAELKSLQQCLSRAVELTVKGQPTKLTLTCPDLYQVGTSVAVRTKASFWLLPVLRNSGRLLTSSDLSRVKVTRTLPGGEKKEFQLDCSDSQRAPAFWLRDGDVIEVPDKK